MPPRQRDDDGNAPKRHWWQKYTIPGIVEYDLLHPKKRPTKDEILDAEVERRNRWRTSAQGKLSKDDVQKELGEEAKKRRETRFRADPTDNPTLPSGWNRWPNTYYALQAQGYFAAANKQEMDMVLDMVRRGWLDGSPNGNHNRKDRMATRVAFRKGFGADWWTFPWEAWREDYARFHS